MKSADSIAAKLSLALIEVRAPDGSIDSDAFQTWFKGSRVVDEWGVPQVCYHGTSSTSKQFLQRGKGDFAQLGFWFDTAPHTVQSYAGGKEKGDRPNLIPVYLCVKNPKEYPGIEDVRDAANGKYGASFAIRVQGLRKELKKAGHDGVVIRSAKDTVRVADYWVAFANTQIKSAIGHSVAFDRETPRILKAKKPATGSGEARTNQPAEEM